MARKIKIDNAILKRLKYKSGKKKVGQKKIKKYVLIVCEGEKTEPNYFNSIKNELPKDVLETFDISIKGTGQSTLKIVETAIEIRKKALQNQNKSFDQVWVVFDRDSFSADDFDNSIFKAAAAKIDVAWSNEAFELWYILHFTYRSTGMNREDYQNTLEREINKAIKVKTGKIGRFKYLKNSETMYKTLMEFGNEEQAIKWAETLCEQYENQKFSTQNPRTLVYKLIRVLNEIRDESLPTTIDKK